MTARTQTLVLTLLGALGIKLVVTGAYLRYVNGYMKWPLLLTSVALLALSARHLIGREQDADRAPRAAWTLLLPVLVVFVVAPPALGAYAAERRPATSAPAPADASDIPPLPDGSPVTLLLIEFATRAEWDTHDSLRDRSVRMEGFVTRHGDTWFLTRLATTCCAADAVSWRVRVLDQPAPPVDQWVRVTGTWRDPGSAVPRRGVPEVEATEVTRIATPQRPYM